jgi:hypothetical protein
MTRILSACIFFLVLSFSKKDTSERLVIKTKVDYFTVDNLGGIYTVHGEELMKYLPAGKFFARYSNLKLGNITTVDATNPLKILLYYHDFQQIVFLDDQLTANSEPISLEALNHEQTELVCGSTNNSFWIYDKQNNELTRFDQNSKRIASTGNLKQVLKTDMAPNYMREYNNMLFLNCPETGIYVFDMFGAFSKIISIKNLKQLQVYEDILYFKRDSTLCSYNHKYFEEACKKVPSGAQAQQIEFNKGKVYVNLKDSVVVVGL